MAKINLSEEDLKLLSECINDQKDVPPELLTKLSPGFFEKLAADGRFDFKALVRTCGKTELGKQADKIKWFPKVSY